MNAKNENFEKVVGEMMDKIFCWCGNTYCEDDVRKVVLEHTNIISNSMKIKSKDFKNIILEIEDKVGDREGVFTKEIYDDICEVLTDNFEIIEE